MSTEKCECNDQQCACRGVEQLSETQAIEQFIEQAGGTGDIVLDTVAVAIVAKFGGPGKSRSDIMDEFLAEAKRVIDASGIGDDDCEEPSLNRQLEALKLQVGEENYKGLLANPRIESIAAHAWEQVESANYEKSVKNLSQIFNGAINGEDVAYFMQAVSTGR